MRDCKTLRSNNEFKFIIENMILSGRMLFDGIEVCDVDYHTVPDGEYMHLEFVEELDNPPLDIRINYHDIDVWKDYITIEDIYCIHFIKTLDIVEVPDYE